MSEETWRPVVRYESNYEVSSFGRVRSIQRIDAGGRYRNAQFMAQHRGIDGRMLTHICKDGIPKIVRVHRLVAEAFLGERPYLYDINHLDGNKVNNKADNLEYCSKSENVKHAFRMGLKSNVGSKNSQSIVSEQDVVDMRRMYREGKGSMDGIGAMFGLKKSQAANIISGRNWKNVPME